MLALQALERAVPDFELTVQSVVASALATELLDHSAEPTTTEWSSLRSQMTGLTKLGHGMTDGCAAARHFTPFVEHPVPAAISKQHLPAGDLVVWLVGDGRVVAVDRDPYVIGRVSGVDLRLDAVVISKRHTRFERSNEGWLIRDLQSASGFSVDGRRIMGHLELRLGAVIQFARPYALVVLAVQPAR